MATKPCKCFLAGFLNCRFCFFISTDQSIFACLCLGSSLAACSTEHTFKLLQYSIYTGTGLCSVLLYRGKQFLTLALNESAICPHVVSRAFGDAFASGAYDGLADDTHSRRYDMCFDQLSSTTATISTRGAWEFSCLLLHCGFFDKLIVRKFLHNIVPYFMCSYILCLPSSWHCPGSKTSYTLAICTGTRLLSFVLCIIRGLVLFPPFIHSISLHIF